MLILAASSDDVKTGVNRLVFYPDERSVIAVRVRIRDDKLVEGTEAFGVQLSVPDHHKLNGVKLGNLSLATVFIKDGMFYNLHSFCFIDHLCYSPTDDKPVTIPPTKPPTTHQPTKPRKIINLLLSYIVYPKLIFINLAVKKMSVKVQFEFSSYQVQESCTMLPVTLVVLGEVIKPFTVDIIRNPIGDVPSAKAT